MLLRHNFESFIQPALLFNGSTYSNNRALQYIKKWIESLHVFRLECWIYFPHTVLNSTRKYTLISPVFNFLTFNNDGRILFNCFAKPLSDLHRERMSYHLYRLIQSRCETEHLKSMQNALDNYLW